MDYKDEIKTLRVRMQKAVEALRVFEKDGSKNAGKRALWEAYYAWNGEAYETLEKKIKSDK